MIASMFFSGCSRALSGSRFNSGQRIAKGRSASAMCVRCGTALGLEASPLAAGFFFGDAVVKDFFCLGFFIRDLLLDSTHGLVADDPLQNRAESVLSHRAPFTVVLLFINGVCKRTQKRNKISEARSMTSGDGVIHLLKGIATSSLLVWSGGGITKAQKERDAVPQTTR